MPLNPSSPPTPTPPPGHSHSPTLAELFHPLTQDGRVGARHMCIYLALLQCRERYLRTYAPAQPPRPVPAQAPARVPAPAPTGRPGPFYIHRDEIMRLAKIQGPNTYYRTMSELDAWGYIEYWPSRRSKGATKVFLPLP